jgi:hypothetical protein
MSQKAATFSALFLAILQVKMKALFKISKMKKKESQKRR